MGRILGTFLLWLMAALPLPAAAQGAAQPAPFKPEELEQLAAPIALYPDALVAQILMASTYPLEIVSAARWVKSNPNLKDKALEDALQKETWDASVKSLAAFPQVLAMMNEKIDWTQKLGDAFLGQQKEVLAAVQRLRAKADAAGNLKSSKEQTVTKEAEGSQTVIKIEPANPQVVYVPTYNPTVVYGTWPYAAYPPYYYYPPGYVAGAAFFSFTAGVIVGSALWGGCNWGRGDVNVNVNKYNSFNRTNVSNSNWNHNSEHRRGVEYRDQGSREKFSGGQQRQGADSREAFRGRTEGGDRAGDRGGDRAGTADRGGDRAGTADRGGDRAGTADRGGDRGGGADRGGDRAATADRGGGGGGGRDASAFQGAGSKGGDTRAQSNRGASSHASAASHQRSGGGGGGARAGGGGGGARAGGGGGGRGGGGGGRR
jgi:hypothetical protein